MALRVVPPRSGAPFKGLYALDDQDVARIERFTPGISQEQREDDHSLGYGNIYYGLVRLVRPRHVLVIGSGYGFTPGVMALALEHNRRGQLTFVDPSSSWRRGDPTLGAGSWDTPQATSSRFSALGAGAERRITHRRMTNLEFFALWPTLGLPPPEVVVIDGSHTAENVRIDWNGAVSIMAIPGFVLLHDSTSWWNRIGEFGVARAVQEIRRADAEVLTFPGEAGLTVIRVAAPGHLLPVRRLPRGGLLAAAAVVTILGVTSVELVIGFLAGRWSR